MSDVTIRKFKSGDAEEVCRMVSKVFDKFVARDFCKKGVIKWLSMQTPEKQIERAKTRDVYVAVAGGRIVGMIEAKENRRITRLFVDEKYHKKEIGRSLVAKIERLYIVSPKVRYTPYCVYLGGGLLPDRAVIRLSEILL